MKKWEKKFEKECPKEVVFENDSGNICGIILRSEEENEKIKQFIKSTLQEYSEEVEKVTGEDEMIEMETPLIFDDKQIIGLSNRNLLRKEQRKAIHKLNKKYGIERKK